MFFELKYCDLGKKDFFSKGIKFRNVFSLFFNIVNIRIFCEIKLCIFNRVFGNVNFEIFVCIIYMCKLELFIFLYVGVGLEFVYIIKSGYS